MKNITYIILVITSLFVISCEGELNKEEVTSEETNIYISDSATALKALLYDKVNEESQINAEIALQSIIELFETSSIDTLTNEHPIDIYVIYGTELWAEYDEEETFQITLAHQTVENKVPYEYRVTLIYEPSKFTQIKEFDLRHKRDLNTIAHFTIAVKDSPGFKKTLLSSPIKIEIIKEEI